MHPDEHVQLTARETETLAALERGLRAGELAREPRRIGADTWWQLGGTATATAGAACAASGLAAHAFTLVPLGCAGIAAAAAMAIQPLRARTFGRWGRTRR